MTGKGGMRIGGVEKLFIKSTYVKVVRLIFDFFFRIREI